MATADIIHGIESGIVINEHYSIQEYVNRRLGWLQTSPYFARLLTGLCKIVWRDALDVFKSDPELSVQEVRRRELACEIDPLLPLPTTENTETLDDYRSYPDREWTPGVMWPASRVQSIGIVDDVVRTGEYSVTAPNAGNGEVSQTAGSPDPLHQDPQAAGTRSESGQTARQSLVQSANIQQTTESGPSRSSHHRSSDQSSSLLPNSSSPMAAVSTRATTPMLGPTSPQGPVSIANMPQEELLSRISKALANPPAPSPSPKNVHVNRNVSALAGRGINLPVKQRDSKKRARSESPDATDSVIGSQVDETGSQAKRPKLTLKGPRDTSLSPSQVESPPRGPNQTRPKKSKKIKQKSATAANEKKSRKPTVQRSKVSDVLEAIIDGTRLPDSKEQAKQAAKLRHERMLAQHRVTHAARKGRKTAQPEPDMMPEFFNVANFAEGQEEDSVRCVCGVTHDDGELMANCEECMVWQHTGCMGEGAKDLTNSYYCQQCDPFLHRRLIARMRQEQPTDVQ